MGSLDYGTGPGDSFAARENKVKKAIDATENLTERQRELAMRYLLGSPTSQTTDFLWKLIVSGLLFILAMAMVALVGMLLLQNDGAQTALTVITTILAGLFGLFAKSPIDSTSGTGGTGGEGGSPAEGHD